MVLGPGGTDWAATSKGHEASKIHWEVGRHGHGGSLPNTGCGPWSGIQPVGVAFLWRFWFQFFFGDTLSRNEGLPGEWKHGVETTLSIRQGRFVSIGLGGSGGGTFLLPTRCRSFLRFQAEWFVVSGWIRFSSWMRLRWFSKVSWERKRVSWERKRLK